MKTRKIQWTVSGAMIGGCILMASQDVKAQVTAFPARGQTPQQQEVDKAACQDFAKAQTGFDPQQALAASSAQGAAPPTSARPRKRAKEEQAEISQQDKQKSQTQQKLQAYNKAESVCLTGKGYSVG